AHGLVRDLARAVATVGDDVLHEVGIVQVGLRALAELLLFAQDRVDDRLLALDAADAGATTARLHPFAHRVVRIREVELPDRALLRLARIGATHPRGIRGHGADLLLDRGRLLAHGDRVAVALRHLLPVGAGQARRLGEQG